MHTVGSQTLPVSHIRVLPKPTIIVCHSDLLILDFEQRKSHLKKLGQKLEEMRSKHHLLLLEQVRGQSKDIEKHDYCM